MIKSLVKCKKKCHEIMYFIWITFFKIRIMFIFHFIQHYIVFACIVSRILTAYVENSDRNV